MKRLTLTDWQIACAIFIAALLLRLVFLFSSPDRAWPHSILYEGDAPMWVHWANALEQGEPFEFDLPLRSPAVAYLMDWLSRNEVTAPFTRFKVLWCVFTALAASLTFLAATMTFGRRVGLIAAGLYSISFGSYIISTSLNNEAMYTLALLLIVLAGQWWSVRSSIWIALAVGGLNGLAMLIRAEHALFSLMLAVWMVWIARTHISDTDQQFVHRTWAQWKRGLLTAIVMLAAASAVCVPWTVKGLRAIHHYNTSPPSQIAFESPAILWTPAAIEFLNSLPAFTRSGSFGAATYFNQTKGKSEITPADVEAFFNEVYGHIPKPLPLAFCISIKGPLDFALANHPLSIGGFSKAALASPDDLDPRLQPARPDHLRLINHGYAVGLDYIADDPGGWLRRVGLKNSRFFDGLALGFTSLNLPLGREGVREPVDMFTVPHGHDSASAALSITWRSTLLAVLAAGVIICLFKRRGGVWLLVIGYKLIVTALFYGYARQAVSILPVFFVMMAVPADQLMCWIAPRTKPLKSLVTFIVTILAIAIVLIDVVGSLRRPGYAAYGPIQMTPQWGAGAFECPRRIELHHAAAIPP